MLNVTRSDGPSSSNAGDPTAPEGGAAAAPKRRRRRKPKQKRPEGFTLDDINPITLGRKSREILNQSRPDGLTLDDLNPISMGRKSREIFDDVWSQLQRIGAPSTSVAFDDIYRSACVCVSDGGAGEPAVELLGGVDAGVRVRARCGGRGGGEQQDGEGECQHEAAQGSVPSAGFPGTGAGLGGTHLACLRSNERMSADGSR